VIDKEGVIRRVIHHEIVINKHWKSVIETLREIEDKQ